MHPFLIEADELRSRLGSEDLRVFDATVLLYPTGDETARDHYRTAHIPGAAFFDHARVSRADADYMFMLLDATELGRAIGELGIGDGDLVVVYSSDMLMWATRAFWVLRYAGHENVRVLNGGLAAWRAAGGDVERGESTYPASRFRSRLRPSMIASMEEVRDAIGADDVCTINALPAAFHEGTDAVAYAAKGHITGSTNTPFSEVVPEERYPSIDQVRATLEAGGYLGDERVISYCGGGIAATVSALGCLMVGKENVAVYDGSLDEWLDRGGATTRGVEPGRL